MTTPRYACPTCGFSLWTPLAELGVSTLGLYDDVRFPGRCLLVLREHHDDLALVPAGLLRAYLDDVQRAGRAVREATGADRVNYAVLGNAQPHVHFHLVPRIKAGDPAPEKAPWETPLPRGPLDSVRRRDVRRALVDALWGAEREPSRPTTTPGTSRSTPHLPTQETYMTQAISEPGRLERRLADGLRNKAVAEIRRRDDLDGVAAELELARPGLEALLWRTEWPLEQAVRVAAALKVIDEAGVERLVDEVPR